MKKCPEGLERGKILCAQIHVQCKPHTPSYLGPHHGAFARKGLPRGGAFDNLKYKTKNYARGTF